MFHKNLFDGGMSQIWNISSKRKFYYLMMKKSFNYLTVGWKTWPPLGWEWWKLRTLLALQGGGYKSKRRGPESYPTSRLEHQRTSAIHLFIQPRSISLLPLGLSWGGYHAYNMHVGICWLSRTKIEERVFLPYLHREYRGPCSVFHLTCLSH
jgi:hypothetical protein